MANLYKKPIMVTDPKTGKKAKKKSAKWWGRYRDAQGRDCRVPLARDKAAAQAMLNELVRHVEREKAGLVDPAEEQRKRPLREHLADFKRCLQNRDVTPQQVKNGRTANDPLAHLSRLNVKTDRRHDRRALTAEEFARLIDATFIGRRIDTIPGPDRVTMYVLAA